MKLLLLGVLALAPGLALACANKIDPNKVMLFIDTNTSALEIATAQKSACARGERLLVVPKNHKEFDKLIRAEEVANKEVQRLGCQNNSTPACKQAVEKAVEASSKLIEFKTKQPTYKDAIRQELEELKKARAKLVNFSISGHDGGGTFSGVKGGLSRQELAEVMQDFTDLNEVKSLLLLGCYTGTQYEVIEWKNIFPDARLIAGYDGSAPLADRPQGHQYIADILNKEKNLVQQSDAKKLQAYLSANLKGINNLSAAMYFQCSDGSSLQEYYYGSKQSRQVKTFDVQECLSKRAELEEIAALAERYMSGELEPPKDTQNGELRALYNRLRTNEHCLEVSNVFIDSNAIFNLLFNEGVEESFAHFYKDDLKEVEKYLNFDPAEMEKTLNEEILKLEAKVEREKALAELIKTSPQAYLAEQLAELEQEQAAVEKLYNDPAYASVKNLVNFETGAFQLPREMDEETFKKMNTLATAVSNYRMKKQSFEEQKKNPQHAIALREQNALMLEQNIQTFRQGFEKIRTDMADPQKRPWIPNAENLKKHTRKELLDNIHRMNSLLFTPVLKPEQEKALRWLTQSTATHLQYFQNPFSWHEFTGRVEEPPYFSRLKDFMKEENSSYMGGYGYGGGWGDPGFSSGSGSGSNGGGMVGGSGSGGGF